MVLFAALVLVLVLLLPRHARAHDMWLEPETLPTGETNLRLLLGDHLIAEEEKQYSAEVISGFTLHGANGPQDLCGDGHEGDTPVRVLPAGALGIVTMDRLPRFLTLDSETFEAYLREEGLHHVSAARKAHNETALPGRETYTRCLKTLLTESGAVAGHPVGQRLEIVPQFLVRHHHNTLTFLVLFNDEPLVGARISAHKRSEFSTGVTETQIGVTDSRGNVAFEPFEGAWLVRLVTMQRAKMGKCLGRASLRYAWVK